MQAVENALSLASRQFGDKVFQTHLPQARDTAELSK